MMVLMHYKLLHYLSDAKLLEQLDNIKTYLNSSIFKEIELVAYISNYQTSHLIRYIRYVYAEMQFRHLEIKKDVIYKYYLEHQFELQYIFQDENQVFWRDHTLRYMIQCYFILEMENTLNPQLSSDDFNKLKSFVRSKLEHELF